MMICGMPASTLVPTIRLQLVCRQALVLVNRLVVPWVILFSALHLQELTAVASCCLIKRSKPARAPPRLVVVTGPSAVGRSQLIARLMAEFPDKFGFTVSHTSRPPMEHEVDGR